jgi:hypothetical protein
MPGKSRTQGRREARQRKQAAARIAAGGAVAEETTEVPVEKQVPVPTNKSEQKTIEIPQAAIVDDVVEMPEHVHKILEVAAGEIYPKKVPECSSYDVAAGFRASCGMVHYAARQKTFEIPQAEIVQVVEEPGHGSMITHALQTLEVPQAETVHRAVEMPEHGSTITNVQNTVEIPQAEMDHRAVVEMPLHGSTITSVQKTFELPQAESDHQVVVEVPLHESMITTVQETFEIPQAEVGHQVVVETPPLHVPMNMEVQNALEVPHAETADKAVEMPGPKTKGKKKKQGKGKEKVESWQTAEPYEVLKASVHEAFFVADENFEDALYESFCANTLLPRCKSCIEGAKILIQYFVVSGKTHEPNQSEYATFIQKQAEDLMTVFVLLWTQLGWTGSEIRRWIQSTKEFIQAFIVDAVTRAQKEYVTA